MKLSVRLASTLLLGAMAATAFAGLKQNYEVYFGTNPLKPYADGDIGAARNSADGQQYIGCEATATLGSCYAVNSAGVYKSCSTTDAGQLAVIRSLHGDGHLFFSWDTSGNCVNIRIRYDSLSPPKY